MASNLPPTNTLLNPLAEEAQQAANRNNNNTNSIGPQPVNHGADPLSTPPQRSTTNPYENNNTTSLSLSSHIAQNNNNNGYLLGNNTINNNEPLPRIIPQQQQLDNKQIAELLLQQDPSFVRLVVPPTAAANTSDIINNNDNNTLSVGPVPIVAAEDQNNTIDNKTATAIVYENPAQPQPTPEEIKQQRRVERISRHYGEEARDRGQQVPLVKPRYGPWRRNKESIRVSTNLTLGQQHNNASELISSGGSFGMKPEKMVVSSGIQHYVDEVHFDTPYAMFRTKDGKIETRSVGWSKRGDFVVERHDLVLTSDYCYSDTATSGDDGNNRRQQQQQGGGKRFNRRNDVSSLFNVEKPKRLAENISAGEEHHQKNDDDDDNDDDKKPEQQQQQNVILRRKQVLQVAHSRFENPLCMDPVAPQPREVVSEGELRQASRNLWRRKYPGVKCPKNRKIRNRLMNDYFVNEHTRPVQLFHAQNQSNKRNNNNNNAGDVFAGEDSDDEDDDDMMLDDFQYQMMNRDPASKHKKNRGGKKALLSFTPKTLPVGFVEFADKTERQQQAILERLNTENASKGSFAFSSSGGLQDKSSTQSQAKRPDNDSAEGRWNRLQQKHKQELSHALTNTEFMPCFIRDVECQIREFLTSWQEYTDDGNDNTKQKPEPYFDVLCRDGYGRLMVHILSQFYLLTSQSHDRTAALDDNNDKKKGNKNNNDSSSAPSSPDTPTQPKPPQIRSNKANRAKNATKGEVQRVTRVMLISQKKGFKPPSLPVNTLCSLFSLNETPSLTPQISPQHNNNKNSSSQSIGNTPTTDGEPSLSSNKFSIGTSVHQENASAVASKKKRSSMSTTPPISPSPQAAASVVVSNVSMQQQEGKNTNNNNKDDAGTFPRVSPKNNRLAAAGGVAETTTSSTSATTSPSFTFSTVTNRFGSLQQKSPQQNVADDSSEDDNNNDESSGTAASRAKRFRKKRNMKFSGVTRRAILPLMNSNNNNSAE